MVASNTINYNTNLQNGGCGRLRETYPEAPLYFLLGLPYYYYRILNMPPKRNYYGALA